MTSPSECGLPCRPRRFSGRSSSARRSSKNVFKPRSWPAVALVALALVVSRSGCEARSAGYLLPVAGIFGLSWKNSNDPVNPSTDDTPNAQGAQQQQPGLPQPQPQQQGNRNPGSHPRPNQFSLDPQQGYRQSHPPMNQNPQLQSRPPIQTRQHPANGNSHYVTRPAVATNVNGAAQMERERRWNQAPKVPPPPPRQEAPLAENKTQISSKSDEDKPIIPQPPPPRPNLDLAENGEPESTNDVQKDDHLGPGENTMVDDSQIQNPQSPDQEEIASNQIQPPPISNEGSNIPSGNGWFQSSDPYPQEAQYQPPAESQGGWAEEQYYGQQVFMMEHELDQALAREQAMFEELQNCTSTIFAMEQQENEYIRHLDALTERVAEIEAISASDRIAIAEYESNCTALAASIHELEADVDKWQTRCADLSEFRKQDQVDLKEMKKKLKAKSAEAEKLAIVIEQLHIAKKRQESASKQSQKKVGFFAWLFGLSSESDRDVGDDELISSEEAHDLAKSTLLRALKTERDSVDELESLASSLEQNNSALVEVVSSRDSVIEELNDRIAVFEEDKIVMKAALRQLQKEMVDEAPKTQKLMKDLETTKKQIKKIRSEKESLLKAHEAEKKKMTEIIHSKDQLIKNSNSNFTAIGTYANKLEERLTSYAIARRDIEAREKECSKIEAAAKITEVKLKSLTTELEEKQKTQDELKKLLKDMVLERSSLQKENTQLQEEGEKRVSKLQQIHSQTEYLSEMLNQTTSKLGEWESHAKELQADIERAESANAGLQSNLAQVGLLDGELKALREKYAGTQTSLRQLQSEHDAIISKNSELSRTIRELEGQIATLEQDMKKRVAELEAAAKAVATARDSARNSNSSNVTSRPNPTPQKEKEAGETPSHRDVPFRGFRKSISKITGVHGAFSPKDQADEPEVPPPTPQGTGNAIKADISKPSAGRSPPPLPDIPSSRNQRTP